MSPGPCWITETDVVELIDLSQAIDALQAGLQFEATGGARNMSKTHVTWGHGDTLHAIGATFSAAGYVGTKTWAHTEGGATPLLIMWEAATGALAGIIEAFALGQMRTGGISGVATRWMAGANACTMALIGTGKQAMSQLAAVAAVRTLKSVRVFGRDRAKLTAFIKKAEEQNFGIQISPVPSVEAATDGAEIVTLVTRAREPFFTSKMAARGAHINAVGAITPEREEFAGEILHRAGLVSADDVGAARRLSKEFSDFYGSNDSSWSVVKPISEIVAAGKTRAATCDLSVFKAMGMGVSDMALGIEILARARQQGRGRPIEAPKRAVPRLRKQKS